MLSRWVLRKLGRYLQHLINAVVGDYLDTPFLRELTEFLRRVLGKPEDWEPPLLCYASYRSRYARDPEWVMWVIPLRSVWAYSPAKARRVVENWLRRLYGYRKLLLGTEEARWDETIVFVGPFTRNAVRLLSRVERTLRNRTTAVVLISYRYLSKVTDIVRRVTTRVANWFSRRIARTRETIERLEERGFDTRGLELHDIYAWLLTMYRVWSRAPP